MAQRANFAESLVSLKVTHMLNDWYIQYTDVPANTCGNVLQTRLIPRFQVLKWHSFIHGDEGNGKHTLLGGVYHPTAPDLARLLSHNRLHRFPERSFCLDQIVDRQALGL